MMPLVRVKEATKSRLDALGETMLRLFKAGAPGIETHSHPAGSFVSADHVIWRAIQALEVDLEADLELYHVSSRPKKVKAQD